MQVQCAFRAVTQPFCLCTSCGAGSRNVGNLEIARRFVLETAGCGRGRHVAQT